MTFLKDVSSARKLVVIKAQRRINFQIPFYLLLLLAENSFPVTVNQYWLLFWKLGYLIITIIEGQAPMHTVCRKTKANAFGNFAFDFTEVRNIEPRKDVCFDTYQNHSIKGAANEDLED